MAYDLSWKAEDGLLHFTVTGGNDPETVRAYMDEIRAIAIERRAPALLVEENLRGEGLGFSEIFSLVSKGSDEPWPGLRAIAFVDTNPEHDPTRMRFAETVAVNRGVNVRVFREVHVARAWLAEDRSRNPAGS